MTARPPIPPPPYRGRCLCGALSYALNARPLAMNACHCSDCKKLTGSTHVQMLIGAADQFTHQGATAKWRKRADSGREIDIVRCAVCGGRLWHEPLASPQLVFIVAGTLDDPSWVIPATHIWAEQAAPNVRIEDDALVIEGQPADRALLTAHFGKLYPA